MAPHLDDSHRLDRLKSGLNVMRHVFLFSVPNEQRIAA